jgi:hypothetical protein
LLVLVVASCGGGSQPRTHRPVAKPCPSFGPAQSERFAFPFDPLGCGCVPTEQGPEYADLACVCSSGHCPSSFMDGLEVVWHACATDKAARASRSDGCGQVVLSTNSGSCGVDFSYDALTGALVGGAAGCDAVDASPYSCEDGMQSSFKAGVKADCAAFSTCAICGGDGQLPACDAQRRCAL